MRTRLRQMGARVLAVVAAVFWGFLWYGLIDLSVVVEQDERFHRHYLFESGWGLLFTVLLAVPMVVLAVRPGNPVASAQLVVVTAAVLVGAVWRAAIPQLWNGLGLAVTAGLLILLGGWAPVRWRRPDLVLSGLAVVGLVAAVFYGAPLIANTTDVEDITIGVSHYPMQASFAIAIAGVVAVAAVTRSRLPAWTAAFSAAWLGVESMVYPHLHASLGTIGGALTVAWAAVVVLGLEIARRRIPPPGQLDRGPVTPDARSTPFVLPGR